MNENLKRLETELFQELKLVPGRQINGYIIKESNVTMASCECPHMIFRIKFSFVEDNCKNLLTCIPECIFTQEINFKIRRGRISIKGKDVKLEYLIDTTMHKN